MNSYKNNLLSYEEREIFRKMQEEWGENFCNNLIHYMKGNIFKAKLALPHYQGCFESVIMYRRLENAEDIRIFKVRDGKHWHIFLHESYWERGEV